MLSEIKIEMIQFARQKRRFDNQNSLIIGDYLYRC